MFATVTAVSLALGGAWQDESRRETASVNLAVSLNMTMRQHLDWEAPDPRMLRSRSAGVTFFLDGGDGLRVVVHGEEVGRMLLPDDMRSVRSDVLATIRFATKARRGEGDRKRMEDAADRLSQKWRDHVRGRGR